MQNRLKNKVEKVKYLYKKWRFFARFFEIFSPKSFLRPFVGVF